MRLIDFGTATRRLLVAGLFVWLLVPGRVVLADDEDSPRIASGPYIGAGFIYAIPNFDLGAFHTNGQSTYVNRSLGADIRGGYRIGKYLAAELDFQYLDRFTLKLRTPGGQRMDLSDLRVFSSTFNLKGYFVPSGEPIGDRLQFYALAGAGGVIMDDNDTSSEFIGRVGAGLDIYLTDNINLFGEYSYNMPAEDLQDFPYNAFTTGLQFHFRGEKEAPPPPPVAAAPPPAPPPPPMKRKIILRAVHFDFDKSNIRADAVPVLNEAVQVLKNETQEDVVVEGHTDSVGTDAYNMKLSLRRADAVKKYLADHGIASSRIEAEGFGESNPVATNETEEGRAQNRRVEMRLK